MQDLSEGLITTFDRRPEFCMRIRRPSSRSQVPFELSSLPMAAPTASPVFGASPASSPTWKMLHVLGSILEEGGRRDLRWGFFFKEGDEGKE
ncbi:hypothetical protein B296_00036086 [Ensete ventricosum]|uniref:Uncharacterized protein n=1 Tax=Ensete ventricosum TaxID=4639 RepID=A0A426ZWH7_ENSVE|nr:hypothetical protein B296_00036086 [Ensete ventricosum]